jgi:hypothetical protein
MLIGSPTPDFYICPNKMVTWKFGNLEARR